jgi:hypothetical protein
MEDKKSLPVVVVNTSISSSGTSLILSNNSSTVIRLGRFDSLPIRGSSGAEGKQKDTPPSSLLVKQFPPALVLLLLVLIFKIVSRSKAFLGKTYLRDMEMMLEVDAAFKLEEDRRNEKSRTDE